MNAARVEFLIAAALKEDALLAATRIWGALPWTPTNPVSVKVVSPGLWSAIATVPASPDTVLGDHHGLNDAMNASGRPTDLGIIRPVRRR